MKKWLKTTFAGILYNTAKYYGKFRRIKYDIGGRLYSKEMNFILSQYLNVPTLHKDRIGRLYCVVNPDLNDNGEFDKSLIILEQDPNTGHFTNRMYVEQWLLKKLRICQDVFKQRDLFAHLSFVVEPVGPEGYDNYLVIIQPTYTEEFIFWFEKLKSRLFKLFLIGLGITAIYTAIKLIL